MVTAKAMPGSRPTNTVTTGRGVQSLWSTPRQSESRKTVTLISFTSKPMIGPSTGQTQPDATNPDILLTRSLCYLLQGSTARKREWGVSGGESDNYPAHPTDMKAPQYKADFQRCVLIGLINVCCGRPNYSNDLHVRRMKDELKGLIGAFPASGSPSTGPAIYSWGSHMANVFFSVGEKGMGTPGENSSFIRETATRSH